MSHFPFVNRSSRGSLSISVGNLYVRIDNFAMEILIYIKQQIITIFVSVFPKHNAVTYLELAIWKL